jgi:hypothetical protein
VNKGIAQTLAKEPARFFAYNNGIAATVAAIELAPGPDGGFLLTRAEDLQIVNGAQATGSLAMARRDQEGSLDGVFVPMKLSVVEPELGPQMVPLISRFANSQNAVRASDFFANHPFHRRMEQILVGCWHRQSALRRFRRTGTTSAPGASTSTTKQDFRARRSSSS